MPKIKVHRPGNEPEDQKLKELILYVAWKSQTDNRFGAIKLNKILFFSDFLAHANLGQSISGQEYQKLEHGPAPRRLVPIREAMTQNGDLALQVTDFYGHSQNRVVPLRAPDLSSFTAREIALVDDVIDQLRLSSGKDVSDLSHRFGGWQIVEIGESIPYATALIRYVGSHGVTQHEREHGESLETMAAECLARSH